MTLVSLFLTLESRFVTLWYRFLTLEYRFFTLESRFLILEYWFDLGMSILTLEYQFLEYWFDLGISIFDLGISIFVLGISTLSLESLFSGRTKWNSIGRLFRKWFKLWSGLKWRRRRRSDGVTIDWMCHALKFQLFLWLIHMSFLSCH